LGRVLGKITKIWILVGTAHPTVSMQTPCRPTAQSLLQKYWGYDAFRSNQAEIIQTLCDQRDALMVMPTGGGKSLCFQVPALLHPGLTIVVSPLVALMEDQVQALRSRSVSGRESRGIAAAAVHYQMVKTDRRKALWQLENGRLKLLYVSPEMLLSPPIWQRLGQPDLVISSLVLDEAHCLSQWGDSFRPSYLRLGAVRSALLQTKPQGTKINLAAFTATADPSVQQAICQGLQLQEPQIFHSSPYRSNLQLSVKFIFTQYQREQKLKQFIRSQNRTSGIVYVRTRNESERLAEWLQKSGFAVAAYHAGLTTGERRPIEQQWLTDKLQFVICTNAFGMGVDKASVRWVAHYHAPLELSEYLQEIGRSGRDGAIAQILLLASEPTGWVDGSDRQRWQYFEQQLQQQQQQAVKLLSQLPPQGNVDELRKQYPQVPMALALLQMQGKLVWHDPFEFAITDRFEPKAKGKSARSDMRSYLKAKGCRWRFLLGAFGVDLVTDWRCGHCDRC
jgi:ATP-dependent DNA helicase RecQ